MGRNNTFNILMYSHDTYGLGHIRRTMAIAAHLRGSHPNINILILTGSPIAGRFAFPEQIDFVRIPGMIKKTNEEYRPLSIKINPRHALDIRKNIITATAKTFQPNLFIVDKEPLGLKKEVLPTLHWLKRCLPRSKSILGLRDVMDDARTVKQDWAKKGVYKVLKELYSEIWVYGCRDFYDPIKEYAIPEAVSRKMLFTGYIPRKAPSPEMVRKIKYKHGIKNGEKLVVVTTGGGGDGFAVMDSYLSMLEANPSHPFKSILITGPFMPKRCCKNLFKRAKKQGVYIWQFYRRMEELLAAADLAVCMGGYNTICEILTQGTVSLVIPRVNPRKEQLIRAQAFHQKGLIEYLAWDELSPKHLRAKIEKVMDNAVPYQKAIDQFELSGFKIMCQRLEAFRGHHL
jgi:predicted glycosyltransferase